MTIQSAITTHVTNKQMRMRISDSFLRKGLDLMPIEDFAKKYDYFSIMQFPNVGSQTADIIVDVIDKCTILEDA